jgi:hypothetical protein
MSHFLNQRLQLLYDLQNNFSSHAKMLDPPLTIILSHEEIGVPSGASIFDIIADLFCHQQIQITRKSKVMQDNIVPCTINQQFNTMSS